MFMLTQQVFLLILLLVNEYHVRLSAIGVCFHLNIPMLIMNH